jgi:hypothetical protein
MIIEKELSPAQWEGAYAYFGNQTGLIQCGNGIHPVGKFCSNCYPKIMKELRK